MRRLLVAVALLGLLGVPASAMAASDPVATLVVSSVHLAKGGSIEVQITYSCERPAVRRYAWEPLIWLDVEQDRGRIATGSIEYHSLDGDAVCDGRTHVDSFRLSPLWGRPVFKGGHATINAYIDASYMVRPSEAWFDQSASIDGLLVHVRRH